MKLKIRIGIFALGAFTFCYGLAQFHRVGVFPYLNMKMQPVFPVGTMIGGVLLILLAFLPAGRWIERVFTSKPQRKARVLQKFPPRHH